MRTTVAIALSIIAIAISSFCIFQNLQQSSPNSPISQEIDEIQEIANRLEERLEATRMAQEARIAELENQNVELDGKLKARTEAVAQEMSQLRNVETEMIRLKNTTAEISNSVTQLQKSYGSEREKLPESPDCPIVVSFQTVTSGASFSDPASIQRSEVLVMKNASSKTFDGVLVVTDHSSGDQRSFDLNIQPFGTEKIGKSQGWRFAKNQTLRISSENFNAKEISR